MGFFEYLDAHPVWSLVYLIVTGFFVVLVVAVRRDYTSTEMLKVLTNAMNARGWNLMQPAPPAEPEEKKGPRPLNG